jgi:hypothetical protein
VCWSSVEDASHDRIPAYESSTDSRDWQRLRARASIPCTSLWSKYGWQDVSSLKSTPSHHCTGPPAGGGGSSEPIGHGKHVSGFTVAAEQQDGGPDGGQRLQRVRRGPE